MNADQVGSDHFGKKVFFFYGLPKVKLKKKALESGKSAMKVEEGIKGMMGVR